MQIIKFICLVISIVYTTAIIGNIHNKQGVGFVVLLIDALAITTFIWLQFGL